MAFVTAAGVSALGWRPLAGRAPCPQLAPVAATPPRWRGVRGAAAARAEPARMQQAGPTQAGPTQSRECDTPIKQFLDAFKPLGRTRLIVRNDAGILEAIGTWDKMFFAKIPSGEYANIIDHSLNLDLHLLLSAVTGAKFAVGAARSASKAPTYAIRLLGADKEAVVLTVFLQWDKDPEDIAPERVEYWKKLKHDYAGPDSDTFFL
jgi:hypothetical protein